MTEVKEKLRKIISAETERCIGRPGGTLSSARDQLKRKYLGYGYAVDADRAEHGYSTYVDRSVMEAVEWAKPGLFRVFAVPVSFRLFFFLCLLLRKTCFRMLMLRQAADKLFGF